MPKAISYARFSSMGQLGNSSEDRQLQRFRLWLAEHSEYEESNLSTIDRAVSAYRSKHLEAGLGKLLEAIEDKRISSGDAIVIESFDRISREDTGVAFERVNKILREGVKIVTLEDGQTYTKESLNSSSVYVLIAKIQASHEYSKRLGGRVKAGWNNNYKKLKTGGKAKAANRPIWIDGDGVLISDVSSMVRLAISRFKEGVGYRAIIQDLNEGYPEISPKSEKSIKRWFTNESIAGYWNGVKAYEGLVTLEEYLELSNMVKLRARHGRPEEKYLLSGLIKCKLCGSSYNFRRQRPRATVNEPKDSAAYKIKPDIVYANCSKYLKTGLCANGFTVPYEFAELVFERLSTSVLVNIAQAMAYKVISRKQYAGLIEKKHLLEENYQRGKNFLLNVSDDVEVVERVKSIRSELDEVNRLISVSDAAMTLISVSESYTEDDFLYGTEDQRRLHDETQKIIYEIESDVMVFRNSLKEYGFHLVAGRSEENDCLGELTNSENSDRYKLIRRSQKDRAYKVNAIHVDEDGGIKEFEYKARRKSR